MTGILWLGVADMRSCETVASKDVNTKAEEVAALGAVTELRLAKTRQTEKI
jgi:hypothetical protein